MGNVDSRAKFNAGYMIVQTDQPFYSPGQLCTAKVYLRITRPLDASHIDLEIKGKEKASFMVQHHRTVGHGDHRRTESYWKKEKSRHEIMDNKTKVFYFANNCVLPGDYCIPI